MQIESQIVSDFHNVDFSNLDLPMIVLYDKPKDFPEHFVARIFNISHGNVQATDMCMIAGSAEEIRTGIPPRFARIERHEDDDANIVESWL